MLMLLPDYKKNHLEELERGPSLTINADHQRWSQTAHAQEKSLRAIIESQCIPFSVAIYGRQRTYVT